MKTCRICKEEKPLSEFENRYDSTTTRCDKCARKYKQYQAENKIPEYWNDYADTSDETPLQAIKRQRVHAPDEVGVWQIGEILAEEMDNVAADTAVMRRFTGGQFRG